MLIDIKVNSILEVVMRNINQLNITMVTMQTNIASNDLTLKAINRTLQSKYQNIDKLNETMVIMQTNIDNYIASNDFTLRGINETLQYDMKTPMVINVPSSDEINGHRSKFSKFLPTKVIHVAKKTFFDLQ